MSVSGNRQQCNAQRNAYTSLLRRNKVKTWRAFCTLEGNQQWGKLYRWLKSGSRRQIPIGPMTRPDAAGCTTIDESVELLLNTLIPNDPLMPAPVRVENTNCDVGPSDLKI